MKRTIFLVLCCAFGAVVLAGGQDTSDGYKERLSGAAGRGEVETMAALLAYDDAYGRYVDEALKEAVEGEHTDAVGFLVEVAGADVDADNGYPLNHASARHSVEMVRALIALGADVNIVEPALKRTPIHHAVLRPDVIRVLAEAGAKVDTRDVMGRTALMRASCIGSEAAVGAVEALLSLGADIHAADLTGKTPLMCAAHWGHLDVVDALIAHDVSVVNARDHWEATALMFAAMEGRADVADRLIASGALLDAKTGKSGLVGYALGELTALVYASAEGHPDVVGVLVEAGASLDIPDEGGWTPLMHAVRHYHEDVAGILIGAGADVNARRPNGTTALGILDGMYSPPEAIRAMLLGAGAVY